MIYGPYKILENLNVDQTGGYIAVLGPNNENVAQIFPFAKRGGIGLQAARAVAKRIAEGCPYEEYKRSRQPAQTGER